MNLAHNRIAVVNGGAGGIGEAVVLRLARDGFCVVILDKNEKAGSQILTELRGRGGKGDFFAIDLTKPDEVNRVFEKIISDLKRVDVLVNLAGGTLHKSKSRSYLRMNGTKSLTQISRQRFFAAGPLSSR